MFHSYKNIQYNKKKQRERKKSNDQEENKWQEDGKEIQHIFFCREMMFSKPLDSKHRPAPKLSSKLKGVFTFTKLSAFRSLLNTSSMAWSDSRSLKKQGGGGGWWMSWAKGSVFFFNLSKKKKMCWLSCVTVMGLSARHITLRPWVFLGPSSPSFFDSYSFGQTVSMGVLLGGRVGSWSALVRQHWWKQSSMGVADLWIIQFEYCVTPTSPAP